ncbi:MAG: von Willebrand factor type A domain-containing protein, partial [Planctomycetia bacterium]|nr:von Willebrand factor type A domain-containing protein [Planctomycetia bacterium]
MRKALPVVLVVTMISAVAVVLVVGCRGYMANYSVRQSRQLQPPKAHGGTHNVNDAAFDAMFFKNYGVNPFIDADEDNLSTFAVDVDTGSYTLCRSYLVRGHLPHKDAVRVEEFINYFDYGYAPPEKPGDAFAIHTEAAPSNFGPGKILLKVAIKARHVK